MKNRYLDLPLKLLGLLVFPLLVLAGCDEENALEPDPDPDDNQHTVAAYDTTDQTSNGGKTIIEVEDVDGGGIGYEDAADNAVSEVTWSSDNVYVLKGRVFVNEGQTLTIEPGTIVQGRYSANPLQASALIVAQGGTILAEGEPDNPIIFTAENDNVDDPSDVTGRGQWGGVIILGRAPTNTTPGVVNIEGIASDIARGQYGCGGEGVTCDEHDDSGVFKYVSIRYGGQSIGENNEINGLTMGGVGDGTTIEYVEVFNNQDDGFEWFGGTVNTKHLVSAFNGDDAFDIDQGWGGDNQFWFAIQATDPAGHAGEHDSGDSDFGGEDSQPVATPQIYNATFIGSGVDGEGDLALKLRDNWGGAYYNSIFTNFPGQAAEIEDLESGEDSRARFEEGTLRIENNIFYDFGAGDTFAALAANGGEFGEAVADYLEQNNRLTDPQLGGISRMQGSSGLDPLPQPGGPAYSNLAGYPSGSFYEQVGYVGAFGSENWARGWTYLDAAGFLAE